MSDVAHQQLASSLLEPARYVRRAHQAPQEMTLGDQALHEARAQEATRAGDRDPHRQAGFLDHASASPSATKPSE